MGAKKYTCFFIYMFLHVSTFLCTWQLFSNFHPVLCRPRDNSSAGCFALKVMGSYRYTFLFVSPPFLIHVFFYTLSFKHCLIHCHLYIVTHLYIVIHLYIYNLSYIYTFIHLYIVIYTLSYTLSFLIHVNSFLSSIPSCVDLEAMDGCLLVFFYYFFSYFRRKEKA